MLTLSILAISWIVVLLAPKLQDREVQVPMEFIYLQLLMILIIGHYFTARATPPIPGERSALGLPRGTIRLVILLAYGGLAWFCFQQRNNYTYDFKITGDQILFVGLMFGGFILGHYFTMVALWWVKPQTELPGWVLDIQAWFAIMAFLGLIAVLLVHLVINPNVSPANKLIPTNFEAGLAGIVGFYFGARS